MSTRVIDNQAEYPAVSEHFYDMAREYSHISCLILVFSKSVLKLDNWCGRWYISERVMDETG
jgi:hypothetical protein